MLSPEETHLLKLLCSCQPENIALVQELAGGLEIDLLGILEQEGFFKIGIGTNYLDLNAFVWESLYGRLARKEPRIGFLQLEADNLRFLKHFQPLDMVISLTLRNISFDNLSGLEYLPSLQELYFEQSRGEEYVTTYLRNWSSLALASPSLRKISALNANINNLLWCEYVPQIEHLNCSYNPFIRSLKGLEHLKKLKYLNLDYCNLNDLEGIEECEALEELHLSKNSKISSLEGIIFLKKLKYLHLDGCQILNLEGIDACENLVRLYLQDNKIEDLSPLYQLYNIMLVRLRNNPLPPTVRRDYKLTYEKIISLEI